MNNVLFSPSMLTEEQYAKCFSVFVKRSHEYEQMLSAITNYVTSMNNKSIKLLSIGAGTGYFDKNVLDNLKSHGIEVEYHAFEPNLVHLKALKERIPDGHIIGDYYSKTYLTHNEFMDKKFDIVLLCHCLYPMENPHVIVTSTLKLLSPSGRTIVFHHSAGDMTNFVKHFNKFMNPDRKVRDDQTLSAEDITEYLTVHDIRYEYSKLDGYIDMKDIWTNDEQLYEMVSFFVQADSHELPVELYEQMVAKLKEDTDKHTNKYQHSTGFIVIG